MIFHMVALSLPVEGYYLPLHKHESAHLCKWTAQDREDFTRIVSQIEAINNYTVPTYNKEVK